MSHEHEHHEHDHDHEDNHGYGHGYEHDHDHGHDHSHDGFWAKVKHAVMPHSHGHQEAALDAALATDRGIWAVKVSLVALLATATFQVFIVYLSGSVALFADTVHNFSDVLTAIRWVGHRQRAEMQITVDCELPTHENHHVAEQVRHALFHALPALVDVTVHVDPCECEKNGDHHHHTEHHVSIASA